MHGELIVEKGDVIARMAVEQTSSGEEYRVHFSRAALDDICESTMWYRKQDLQSLREAIAEVERKMGGKHLPGRREPRDRAGA